MMILFKPKAINFAPAQVLLDHWPADHQCLHDDVRTHVQWF